MPTAEGSGRAKRALEDTFGGSVSPQKFQPKSPMAVIAGQVASRRIEELLGFWLLWHTSGGFEGLQDRFGMSHTTIFRRVKAFREMFGAHPDDFDLPGVPLIWKYRSEFGPGGADRFRRVSSTGILQYHCGTISFPPTSERQMEGLGGTGDRGSLRASTSGSTGAPVARSRGSLSTPSETSAADRCGARPGERRRRMQRGSVQRS